MVVNTTYRNAIYCSPSSFLGRVNLNSWIFSLQVSAETEIHRARIAKVESPELITGTISCLSPPPGSPYRDKVTIAILQLQEEGKLHMMK